MGNGTPCQRNPSWCPRATYTPLGQGVSAWPMAYNSLTYSPCVGKMVSYKQTRTQAKISTCIQPAQLLTFHRKGSVPIAFRVVLRLRLNFVGPQGWHHLSPYSWENRASLWQFPQRPSWFWVQTLLPHRSELPHDLVHGKSLSMHAPLEQVSGRN